MTIKYEIEYKNEHEILDYIQVEFLGDPTLEDDSYGDEFGLVKIPPYPIVEEIKWRPERHSFVENKIIEQYLTKNFEEIAKLFIAKYKELAYD